MANPARKTSLPKEPSALEKNAVKFISEHPEISNVGLLFLICLFFIFFGLGLNPLMDMDETKYAVISKALLNSHNWNNLMFNGAPFLEKSPLFFWVDATSLKLFGDFNPFIVRFPTALLSLFLVFFIYYFGRRLVSRKFGLMCSATLAMSFLFMVASHLAVTDVLLTVFISVSIFLGFLADFSNEENREYYWFFTYIFMGLSFLTQGVFGLAIPFAVLLIYNSFTKNLKEMFKPINIIPGLISLLAVTCPWHYLMYKEYGNQFLKDYFLVQNFSGFIDYAGIENKEPFWYFIPVFLAGFMPWSFVFLTLLYNKYRNFVNEKKKISLKFAELIKYDTTEQKILLLSKIAFIVIFISASCSGAKPFTYILPVFPFASLIIGHFWWESDETQRNEKLIHIATMIFATILILSAVIFSLSYYFLSAEIKNKFLSFMDLAIIGLYLIGIFIIFRLNTKRALSIYAGYVATMFFATALTVSQLFTLIYNQGQNELIGYSTYSNNSLSKTQLVSFDIPKKPSLLINYTGNVKYLTSLDFKELDKILDYKNGPTFLIVSSAKLNEDISYRIAIEKRAKLIKMGDIYSLYVQNPTNEFLPVY